MPIPSVADLVSALRDHQILDSGQLETLARALQGRTPDPRAVARELVKRGWITTYQANLLYQGRGKELVMGEYLVLERLGEGGMGQVFKARHQLMNRIVALKVIPPDRLAHPELAQRFRQEIQAAAKLSHPNIVTAYDAKQVDGTHFLVMEYVEGSDLHSLVQKNGILPVGQACSYVRQAALGLEHAAMHRLVHRDIKPSNLQVTADGQTVKILDLGLARLQDGGPAGAAGLTQAHSLMGTPDYIAPEQIVDARSVDARADIYSLGCTLYFLLAGQPPFASTARWEEKLVCHSKSEPVPIEQIRSDVPADLGAVLRKMMAKVPDQRYPNPAAVAEALAPFCAAANPMVVPVGSGAGAAPELLPTAAYQPPGLAPVTAIPSATQSGPSPASWNPMSAPTIVPASGSTVPGSPATPFSEPTQLAPLPQGQPAPASGQANPVAAPGRLGGRKGLLAVVGLVLAALVVVAVVMWSGGKAEDEPGDGQQAKGSNPEAKGSTPAPDAPKVFVDEDFADAYKNKLNIPRGWKDGDAFRIVNVMDEPCLEVGSPTGVHFVTLPPVKLDGDFYVEGGYILSYYHAVTLRFENRGTNTILPIVFETRGAVAFAADVRAPLPNYTPHLPTKFQIVRKGSKISVALNGDVVAVKDMGEATEFDTLKLGMTAGHQYPGRLFRLKVGTLPPSP